MENKSKIISFFISFLLVVSCTQPTKNSDNEEYNTLQNQIGHIMVREKKYFFEVPCLYTERKEVKGYYVVNNDVIRFGKVLNVERSDTIDLENIVDTVTFRMVAFADEEKSKIRNPYYFEGRMNCYYTDSKNFYAYIDDNTPQFLWLGSSKDAKLLGGNYVRINNKIYSRGRFIDSADVESFHTMEIPQFHNKNEWSVTIGLDSKHMYSNENIMDENRFKKVVFSNDSLKQIYFQKIQGN